MAGTWRWTGRDTPEFLTWGNLFNLSVPHSLLLNQMSSCRRQRPVQGKHMDGEHARNISWIWIPPSFSLVFTKSTISLTKARGAGLAGTLSWIMHQHCELWWEPYPHGGLVLVDEESPWGGQHGGDVHRSPEEALNRQGRFSGWRHLNQVMYHCWRQMVTYER